MSNKKKLFENSISKEADKKDQPKKEAKEEFEGTKETKPCIKKRQPKDKHLRKCHTLAEEIAMYGFIHINLKDIPRNSSFKDDPEKMKMISSLKVPVNPLYAKINQHIAGKGLFTARRSKADMLFYTAKIKKNDQEKDSTSETAADSSKTEEKKNGEKDSLE